MCTCSTPSTCPTSKAVLFGGNFVKTLLVISLVSRTVMFSGNLDKPRTNLQPAFNT